MSDTNAIIPDKANIKSQESYTLPSKGIFYLPQDNIPASLTLRRMTTKEEKIRLRNQGEDRIRKDLLQACIIEPIDAGKLKLEDANFLLFRLRALSLLDDTYKIHCYCSSCGTEFVHQINLSEVPIKFAKDDAIENLKLTLPFSGTVLDLKIPNLDDIITMGSKMREYVKNFPNADKGELLYSLSTVLYIDKVNGHTLISEELENYIDKLDIIDIRALKEKITEIDSIYGFDDNLKTKCPTCNKEIVHGLPITNELFNPSK